MSNNFHPKKNPSIRVIDLPNIFDEDTKVCIRTVALYPAEEDFDIVSTPSNSHDLFVIFLGSRTTLTENQDIQLILNIDTNIAYFKRFENADECFDFITSLQYEKVFLILLLTEAKRLLPIIYDISQLLSIYVCTVEDDIDINPNELTWLNSFPVVRGGIHRINDKLFESLEDDIITMRSRLMPSTLFSLRTEKTTSVKTLKTEHVSFRWSQMLLNTLQRLPQDNSSREDILNECKLQYSNDEKELKKIDEFEKTYHSQLAVRWYTRDSFLCKLINKALQTDDIDIIFKFRFFITDLYNQLNDLHNEFKLIAPNLLRVYRGQHIAASELENLKMNIDDIISLKPFLSTTRSKDTALIYAGNGSDRPFFESVLFEITIDVHNLHKPLADISKISQFSDEDEVLLSMGMTFIVKAIEKIDNNVWQIQLISIDDTNIEPNVYFERLQEYGRRNHPLLELAALLIDMEFFDKAEKYFLMLLEEDITQRAEVYNRLGICHHGQGNYRRALHCYQQAINHLRISNNSMHPMCIYMYQNIATIYQREGHIDKALEFYSKALEIHEQYPEVNIGGFICTLTNLARLHAELGHFDDALKKCLHALHLAKNSTIKDESNVVFVYKSLGYIYGELGQNDKSMEYYKMALNIYEKTKLNDCLSMGEIHLSIGNRYSSVCKYDNAFYHFKKAEQVLKNLNDIGKDSLATLYCSIGIIYRKKQNYDLAMDYYQKSLKIRKQYSPEASTAVAQIYCNIGVVYNEMNIPKKGIEHFQMAIDHLYKCTAPNETILGSIYTNLGRAYELLEDTEQALYYLNLSLHIKQRFYPENHPIFTTTFSNIAVVYAKKGDFLKAIEYKQKSLKILERIYDRDHPDRRLSEIALFHFKQMTIRNMAE